MRFIAGLQGLRLKVYGSPGLDRVWGSGSDGSGVGCTVEV